MCALSATLRSKPKWWTKYTDSEIRARWKQEAVGATPPFGDISFKEEEVDYVLDELSHFAALRDTNTGIEASVSAWGWSCPQKCASFILLTSTKGTTTNKAKLAFGR